MAKDNRIPFEVLEDRQDWIQMYADTIIGELRSIQKTVECLHKECCIMGYGSKKSVKRLMKSYNGCIEVEKAIYKLTDEIDETFDSMLKDDHIVC